MYALQHNASRCCSRCGKELTDAASMNEGVGPVCRKLDNELLATVIPSDVAAACQEYKAIDALSLPAECVKAFCEVEAALVAENAKFTLDFRKPVKQIEWILSFNLSYGTRAHFIGIVRELGYLGLASLWKGEAATGKALIAFKSERLFIQAPRNKSARIALRKLSPRFHAATQTEKAEWSVAPERAHEFRLWVWTYYPNHENLDSAIQAATLFVAMKPTVSSEAKTVTPSDTAVVTKPSEPLISVVEVGSILRIKTPFKDAFISRIKSLPYSARRWVSLDRVWEVDVKYKAQVDLALKDCFFDICG